MLDLNITKLPGEQNLFSRMLGNLMFSSITKVFQFVRPKSSIIFFVYKNKSDQFLYQQNQIIT